MRKSADFAFRQPNRSCVCMLEHFNQKKRGMVGSRLTTHSKIISERSVPVPAKQLDGWLGRSQSKLWYSARERDWRNWLVRETRAFCSTLETGFETSGTFRDTSQILRASKRRGYLSNIREVGKDRQPEAASTHIEFCHHPLETFGALLQRCGVSLTEEKGGDLVAFVLGRDNGLDFLPFLQNRFQPPVYVMRERHWDEKLSSTHPCSW